MVFLFRLGGKETILLSLYGCSISTIAGVVIGDYYTLLLSRFLIGAFSGLNMAVHCIFMSERMSSKQIFETSLLCLNLVFTFGGVWIPTLGYFLLDVVGWRFFVLLTSFPVFFPAILLLHFCVAGPLETSPDEEQEAVSEKIDSEGMDSEDVIEVPNFIARLCKISIFGVVVTYQGWGTILLLPALIRLFNIKDVGQSDSNCDGITQGWEFLLLALVNAAADVGRVANFLFRGKIRFRVVFTLLAAATVASYSILFFYQDTLWIIVLTSFIVKLTYGIMAMESEYISFDVNYFGSKMMSIGAGIALGLSILGALAGTAIASFATPGIAALGGLAFNVIQVFNVLSMYERD